MRTEIGTTPNAAALAAGTIAAVGAATLAGAWFFQYVLGIQPCPMCLGAILWARLDCVVYACGRADAARVGFDDARFYEEMARLPEQRALPMSQALRDEGLAAFVAWQANAGRMPY